MSGHSPLSPSSSHRWVNCPGSVLLSQQYPEMPMSAGAEGTAVHWFAAEAIRSGVAPKDAVSPNGVTLSDEMREHGKDFAALVHAFQPDVYVEEQVTVLTVHDQCFGTCDAFVLDYVRRSVRIWDFKYGHGFVDVFENPQMLLYAAGIWELIGGGADWTFDLCIFQPRSYHRDGPERHWVINTAVLREHLRHIKVSAEAAISNNPPTNAGVWCKHCPARHVCPALQTAGLDACDVANDATPLELPAGALALELTTLTRAQAVLEARLAGLTAQAESTIKAGNVVPGWGIEHSAGREEWSKPIEEVQMLGKLYGVELLQPPKPVTPAQARKAGIPAQLFASYSARKAGSAKLVPVTTKDARRVFGV